MLGCWRSQWNLKNSFNNILSKALADMHFAVFFILLKEEMVVVYFLQVFTSWAVNILTDLTSTNQSGLLSLTALKNYVNRIEDE